MPLRKGSSKATISSNIRECILSYEKSGKVGNIKPRNIKHAMSICQAVAYSTAHRSKKRSAVSEALR